MKKILLALLVLLGASNTINCMEQKEEKFEYFQYLPPELRCKIIATILEENIDKWDDIFNFDRNSLKEVLDEIRLVSKDFVVLGKKDLEKFIRSLRQHRSAYLQKGISEQYKNLSKEDLNKKLMDLLHLEITQEGLEESVRLIIAGAAIDIQDNDGWTALMWAASSGHAEIVRVLIDQGAAIDIEDNDGRTALVWTADRGHIETVRLLIDKGAAIDIQDNMSWTALMLAARYGHAEIARLLIDNGADIDIKNINGSTALIWARQKGHTEIIYLLCEKDLGCFAFLCTLQ